MPRGHLVFALGTAVALGLTGIACRNESVPAPGPRAEQAARPAEHPAVRWLEGHRYLYSVKLSSRAAMGGDAPSTIELTAELELLPVRARGAAVELALRLLAPKLESGDAAPTPELAALSQELTKPYGLVLNKGRIEQQRFTPGVSATAAAMLRTLSAGLQVAAAPNGKNQKVWAAREYDSTGEYQAEYSLREGELHKRKTSYEKTLMAGNIDAANRARVAPKVLASNGKLRIENGVLASVQLEDEIESQVLLGSALTVKTTLALELTSGSPSKALDSSGEERLAKTVLHPANRPYGAVKSGGQFDQARIQGRSFEQVLAELEQQAKRGGVEELWGKKNGDGLAEEELRKREERQAERVRAFGALVALLRQDPGNVDKARRQVRAGSAAAKQLMDGLGSAGTEHAQAVLGELIADEQLPGALRVSGASSLVSTTAPSASTIETLKALLNHSLLREHAVFGLGIAARHLREAEQHDASRGISELLLVELEAATTTREQIRCLRGIANSAYPGALGVVRVFAHHDEESIRAAALEAMRLVEGPEVDLFIAERMTKDPDARVRTTAVRVAKRRAPSPALETALTALALHDEHAPTRQGAVELLGRWLPDRPSLRSTIEQVANADERNQIRAVARAALDRG
jgi:hypothetical protein